MALIEIFGPVSPRRGMSALEHGNAAEPVVVDGVRSTASTSSADAHDPTAERSVRTAGCWRT
jgi:hypothetical protein